MARRTNGPARQVVGKSRTRKNVQARGQVRRRQLLEAAHRMLVEIPIEELTFGQIAAEAGVPEGSAYHFYANKYDLISSLARHLGAQFLDAYGSLVDESEFGSWRGLADVIIDRTAEIYAADPAAVQIFLGGKTPPEVGLVDRKAMYTVSEVLRKLFDHHFVMPDVPMIDKVFYYFVHLTDRMLSLSVIEHGKITPWMLEESKRAGKGYLATYLPPVLARRMKPPH